MNFYLKPRLITGRGCIAANSGLIGSFGKRCMIVCGAHGAEKSGALADVTSTLDSLGIEWKVYNGIAGNPSLESCFEAGRIANAFKADFIFGIGGGSALDAAKTAAVAASNPDIDEEGFYAKNWPVDPIPVLLAGTTAGTGSEVTDVAVLTDSRKRKHSIHDERLFSAVSFGDPSHTVSLSKAVTLSTGVDALAHCLESAYSKKASDISRAFSARGIGILVRALSAAASAGDSELDYNTREDLYNASILGGLAISITGTVFCHNVGYYFTENKGLPHGIACALFIPELIDRMEAECPEYSKAFLSTCGTDASQLKALVKSCMPEMSISMTAVEIESALPRWKDNGSVKNTMCTVTLEDIREILTKMFTGKGENA